MLLLLFLLSTAFSFAVGPDQKNYFVVGIMALSCLFYFISILNFYKGEVYAYIFYISLFFCLVEFPKSFRDITLEYTLMFVMTFVVYLRMLYSGLLKYQSYLKLLKYILYAYFIMLVLQQICVMTHYPIINYILGDSDEFKLNALAPEPSLSARIVVILFYSYICMREYQLNRSYRLFSDSISDWWVWLCFLYLMLTMGSATAYFLLAIFIIGRFISIPLIFGWAMVIVIYILFSFQELQIIPLQRIATFVAALLSNSPENIIVADHSASIRVLPVYYYIYEANVFSFDFWFGKGIDYSKILFPMRIPGLSEDSSVGGIFPSLFLNHGMLSGILLILMVYKNCFSKLWSYSALLAAILVFSCGLNTQMSWLVFILLATNRYFESKKLSDVKYDNRHIT